MVRRPWNFVGHRWKVASLLYQIKSKGPKYGLQLSMSKCETFWLSGDHFFPKFPSDAERVVKTKGGVDFLGSPLCGSEEIFNTNLSTPIYKILKSQQRMQDMEDPLAEPLLLRSCLSLCKTQPHTQDCPT